MGINIVYTNAFLSRSQAEEAREDFLQSFRDRLESQELFILEDEVKYVNLHYITRILLGPAQRELFDE